MVELETLSPFVALERRAVTLSDDEAQVCKRLAGLLFADALRAYEVQNQSTAKQHQAPVDLNVWKLVKKKDQLCAYKQRKEAMKVVAAAVGDQQQCTANDTELPLLMVTGNLAGRVDDAMFGLTSANTRAMKMNSAYAEDAMEDAEVLATIEAPTVEEPFRFLGIKWAVRRDAMSGSSFVKRRDLLYLEATGTSKLTNGDRVGYRVMHSVSIKALAELATTSISSSVIRARTSIVQIFHQQHTSESSGNLTGTLNVFSKGYYDPQGGMMQFMAVNAGAEMLLHMTFSAVDCAHLKKIAFSAQQNGRRRRAMSQTRKNAYAEGGMCGIDEVGDEDGDIMIMKDTAWATTCSLCDRRVSKMLNRSGAPCTICTKMVCSRCSVVKKLRFMRNDDSRMPTGGAVDLGGSMGIHEFEQMPESASRASTERSRSRSSSGSGVSSMSDICQKALKFCLPCVLRANQRTTSEGLQQCGINSAGCTSIIHSNYSSRDALRRGSNRKFGTQRRMSVSC
ncbi:hypothetical protein BBO99_00002640 [Phytophthora kernoviae]|uniref:FYVE-type domain-containing protein n=2 Tax=Phytophthora kernoviae TaxID=325452 RepID=A0A3R7KM57_9STRA|nr:hypothetical protein G195_004562 [Phytophthora kernoviae 00238/432]KAG2526938.1 hypothetical protein JM16_002774 [Phytophthora kernoviae]KAG2528453.1 hypothetical protein JM18_002614 [Phytophthora kernoviae]RLN14149.1 hypothetical protein BBI17_002584 [Phytophthora kernoviae]RLN82770.1 hypothetical protein BBO99_00002640 [Phytophthora kernoviae]